MENDEKKILQDLRKSIIVITELTKSGTKEKVKVMVGGAAVTEEFAQAIGADGYDPTAPGAVELAKKLIKEK